MKFIIKSATIALLLATSVAVFGQEEKVNKELTVNIGADLVSSYVWRGMYQAGASVQPAIGLSAFGVTLGAWGSTDFSTSFKEIDLSLSYEYKGFRAGISDYWYTGEGESYYKHATGEHNFEASLGYTFSKKFPLSLDVYTLFYGNDDKDEEGKQFYSTYISATYPFTVKKLDYEVGLRITPYKSMYSDNKFDIVAISAKATKKLQFSANYSLPVFVELILSPAQDNAFVIFGIQF